MSRAATLLGSLVLAAAGFGTALSVEGGAAARGTAPAPASFRLAKGPESPALEALPPVSLTASDGTGLALVALEANGVLEPPLAFTELHLTFDNPRDETIEGRFRVTLPPGAAISRFALKIGEGWQEGEVVERQQARVVYEDFLHRRQDPALLEQEAGNEFSARIFPIPARGRKEVIVSWSHALTRSSEPYVLPLRGLATVGRLDVRLLLGSRPVARSGDGLEVSDRRVVELHQQDWQPDRDFEVRQEQVDPGAGRAGLRHENLLVARVAPVVESVPRKISGLYVLVDSSASRALGWRAQTRRVFELITALRDDAGASTPLGVAAFDQEVVPLYEGTVGGFGSKEARALADRRPLGASDPGRALTWLRERLERGRYPRVLLVTDGVATAGETETRALRAAVKALAAKGVERLDVMAVGGLRDEAVLRELVAGNLSQDGQRLDGAAPLAEITRRLTLACRSGIRVGVDGAAWVWPETLDGVQPGDEALVYADLGKGRTPRLTLDGQGVALGTVAETERPLLERAWVQARIERLTRLREGEHAGDEDLRRAITREITDLSVKHRVLSPFTALLVLETEFDYERYGLDRRALADILTVGPGGLDVLARQKAFPTVRPRSSEEDARKAELESLGYLDGGEPESVPAEVAEVAEADGVVAGVAGSVEGGVAGGTAGGVVGTAPQEVPVQPPAPPPPPRPAAARPELEAVADSAPVEDAPVQRRPPAPERQAGPTPSAERKEWAEPYMGRFAEVMAKLAAGRPGEARILARAWIDGEPGDLLALLAWGEVLEASGELGEAARAYGSLIDLFPGRADLRRVAGERLERLGEVGLPLAVDTYRKAVLDRPDHPSGHRLLAWALLRSGRPEEAFQALEAGLDQRYPGGRFAGVDRILREDFGLVGAAWLRAELGRRAEVMARLKTHQARLEEGSSVRLVLTWETDANDVDLHVWDREGSHASYENKTLRSGGELYADVTTGYGPECFTIPGAALGKGSPYRVKVHYYRRGPMGYGMGTLQVVRHDGRGGIAIDPRPFVVMADDALVDLGEVGGKTKG